MLKRAVSSFGLSLCATQARLEARGGTSIMLIGRRMSSLRRFGTPTAVSADHQSLMRFWSSGDRRCGVHLAMPLNHGLGLCGQSGRGISNHSTGLQKRNPRKWRIKGISDPFFTWRLLSQKMKALAAAENKYFKLFMYKPPHRHRIKQKQGERGKGQDGLTNDDVHILFWATKRRFGTRAVDRNLARRRVKESLRVTLPSLPENLSSVINPNFFYLVTCKIGCLDAAFADICRSWEPATRKLHKVMQSGPQRAALAKRNRNKKGEGKRASASDDKTIGKSWRRDKGRKLYKANQKMQKKVKGDMKALRKVRRDALYGKET